MVDDGWVVLRVTLSVMLGYRGVVPSVVCRSSGFVCTAMVVGGKSQSVMKVVSCVPNAYQTENIHGHPNLLLAVSRKLCKDLKEDVVKGGKHLISVFTTSIISIPFCTYSGKVGKSYISRP